MVVPTGIPTGIPTEIPTVAVLWRKAVGGFIGIHNSSGKPKCRLVMGLTVNIASAMESKEEKLGVCVGVVCKR